MKASGFVLFVVAGLLVLAGVVTGLVAAGRPPWGEVEPAAAPVTPPSEAQITSERLAEALDHLAIALEAQSEKRRPGSATHDVDESADGASTGAAALRALLAALPATAPIGPATGRPPVDPQAALEPLDPGLYERAFTQLRALPLEDQPRVHYLWTQGEILARYGPPLTTELSGHGTQGWFYRDPQVKWEIVFEFKDGLVIGTTIR